MRCTELTLTPAASAMTTRVQSVVSPGAVAKGQSDDALGDRGVELGDARGKCLVAQKALEALVGEAFLPAPDAGLGLAGVAHDRARADAFAGSRVCTMEEQSGRKFAPADPTAGAQDATFQERSLGVEIPLSPRRRLQHLQRPTPSHISQTHRVLRAAAMTKWREVAAAV
jgi:hypothetical protein